MFSPIAIQLAGAERAARLTAQAEADRLVRTAQRTAAHTRRQRRRARRLRILTTAPIGC
jgi:hypothetical protein